MQVNNDYTQFLKSDETSQSGNETSMTTDCTHPQLRHFTFSDGLAIYMCPDCSVPFTTRTESLTDIDKWRSWILHGKLPN